MPKAPQKPREIFGCPDCGNKQPLYKESLSVTCFGCGNKYAVVAGEDEDTQQEVKMFARYFHQTATN